MIIKLVKHGSDAELLLEGRMDSASSMEAEDYLRDVADRFDNVVIDMKKVDYITSAGLRVLKMLHVRMNKKEGKLILRNVNRMIMEVFEMTGFVSLLNIE